MTPDKRVKEIVSEFDKLYIEHCSDGEILDGMVDAKQVKKWLRTTLTQYHQDLMSEVVEKIRNFDHNDNHLCRFNDAPQKCECYYGGIETAQTIIKLSK